MAALKGIGRFFLAVICMLGWQIQLEAQSGGYLSRKISIHLTRVELTDALDEIGKAGHFRFSYDADFFKSDAPVTIHATNVAIEKILRELLGKKFAAKEIGNHVILVRSREEVPELEKAEDYQITGVIYSSATRQRVPNATVYEIEKKRSAITALNGSYSLIVPGGKNIRGLCFSKAGFVDTIIFVKTKRKAELDVLLKPLEPEFAKLTPKEGSLNVRSVDSMGFVNWLVPVETRINSANLVVRSSRTFQASIIPYIGTNWQVTGSITNRFSLNLLAGYTGGVKGVEVGGLLNIVRNDVNGVQVGGLGNVVGGLGKGWQVGGLFNYNLNKFNGVQLGGLMNFVTDTVAGIQIGGLTNILTGTVKGVQVSGLTNIVTKNCDGWQVSGLLNLTLKDVKQVQIAGLVNYGRDVDGVQIAGLVNLARMGNSGVQVAGLFNYATVVNGVQLGLINVSNTVERGVPVGLFSYVQQGYHLFELSGNETFYGNIAFKSGTKAFYNFIQFGVGADYKLQASYGIGTIFTLKKKLSMNLDASAGFVYHPIDTVYHGLLLKFYPAFEYRFLRHIALFAGPSYNFFLFPKGDPSATPRGISTYDFYFESTENASIQMWIGGVFGVRF